MPNSMTAESIVYKTLQILTNGNSRASYNELVRKSGFGKTTVINVVNKLIVNNKIKKDKVFGDDGSLLSNRYELVMATK